MKLKRVKTGTKRRWKKGHSCVSNPENSKFREEAKGNFFQKLSGESSLTVEALAVHAAALSVEPRLCADPSDDKSIGRTWNTFATNFTTCTIPAFENFFKNFTVDSELQTRMLAIHAAAQEYIREANLTETSTSYMCALMVSLEGIKDSEEDVVATLSLLAKVIRKVAKEVLKAQFGEYSKQFDDIFTTFATTNNTKLIINIIGCLSVLLRAQNEIQWTYPYTMNLFQKLICYTTHENDDIRRAAQYNVSAVLKGSSFMNPIDKEDDTANMEEGAGPSVKAVAVVHPAGTTVGKFIITNLKLASQNMNGKATLYLLIFLQQVIKSLPLKMLEQCCARVLGVMHIGDAVVNSRSLKVFGSLFSNEAGRGFSSSLTLETTEALLNALTSRWDATNPQALKLVPGMNNAELSIIWMDVVISGIILIVRQNESSGIQRFCTWMEELTLFWKSDFEAVHEKVWHIIDYMFDECIKPLDDKVSSYANSLLHSFCQIEKCLSLQYEAAWPYVFSSLCPYFGVLSKYCSSEMMPCLKNLCSMADTPDLKGKRQLEKTIGAAVNGMGSEEVMRVAPLQITGDIREDERNFWILPILKKFVKNSSLCFFESYFVHLASKCYILLDKLKEQRKLDTLTGKTYQQIERQIWALLPSYADNAVDIEAVLSIQSFAKLICDHIKFREDTRLDVMAALRNMLKCSAASSRLALYGKNYMPALFNVYLMKPRDKYRNVNEGVVESGQRLAAYATIQSYLSILPATKIQEFFNLIISRFESETSDMFKKKSLLNLSRCFLPYLDAVTLETIFQKTKSDIETKNPNLQKSAYRILEEMFCTNSERSKEFVREHIEEMFLLLFKSKVVVPNAKASRLKCFLKFLAHLSADISIEQCDSFLQRVVLESIKYCGNENSTNTRKAAFALLPEVGNVVQRIRETTVEGTFDYCTSLLPSLLPSSDITANTILALMALTYQFQDLMAINVLPISVSDVSELLLSGNRSIIKSSLSFIRMTFALYSPPVVSDYVDLIVRSIVKMPVEDRKKFRIKLRDIFASLVRKFGADRIRGIVPKEDVIHKMLTNIVKKDNRHKRTKKNEEESEDEDETQEAPTGLDEILDEIDKEIENDNKKGILKRNKMKDKKKMERKKKTWIKEDEDDIVDLLDLNSAQNITSKKPKVKQLRFEEKVPQTEEEKYGFKIDKKTNKFIITEQGNDRDDQNDNEDDDKDFMAFEEVAGVSSKTEGKKNVQMKKRKRTFSEDSNNANPPSTKRITDNEGKSKMKNKFDYGAEFRSKKAGGDLVKKGGVAPYAYVQFSREKLNKRKKAKYAGQFKNLVKGAKKGVIRGSKIRAKRK